VGEIVVSLGVEGLDSCGESLSEEGRTKKELGLVCEFGDC
jgi:hypothetical protein